MDRDQPSARSQRTGQRRDYALRLEFERSARAIWLRRDDEVVIGDRAARLRNDRIEQEFVILAIDHEDHRALVDWIAGFRAHPRLPVLRQKRLEVRDLLLETVSGLSGKRHLVPHEACRRA